MEPEQPENSDRSVAAAGVTALVLSTALLLAATIILVGARAGLDGLVLASVAATAVGALVFQSLTNLRGIGTFVGAFLVLLVGSWLAAVSLVALIFLVFKPTLFVY
jgi:hypothetical protein